MPQQPTKKHQETPNNNNKFECEYCLNIFSRNDSLNRHYTRCKIKKSDQNSKDEIIDTLKEEINNIKSMLMDVLNKNCKVHHKTLQKINKQLNGDHNTVNENINKGTLNNTYNIIGLGHENLTDVFSKKEKMNILKYRFNSLPGFKEPRGF